jgi:hypothetical protein
MFSRIAAVLFTAFLFAQARSSRAETFTYTFVAGSAGQLSFQSPSILDVDTILPSSSVVTNIANLASFEINPTAGECNGNDGQGVSCAGIVFSNSDGFFIFFLVPLNTTGVFGSDGETLTISQTPSDLSPVPEPTSMTLFALGMLVGAAAQPRVTLRKSITAASDMIRGR